MESLYARFDARIGVCSDSRSLASGQIFFALRGGNFNGNLFAPKALDLGASTVVVDELVEWLNPNDPRVVHVPDVLIALQDLARTHRRAWGKTVVGFDWYLSKDWKLGMPHHIPQTTAQQNSGTSSAYEVD